MEYDDSEKGSLPIVVKLLHGGEIVDIYIPDQKPGWANEENTSVTIVPELRISTIIGVVGEPQVPSLLSLPFGIIPVGRLA